jgi:rRNA maturation RNase YbeY
MITFAFFEYNDNQFDLPHPVYDWLNKCSEFLNLNDGDITFIFCDDDSLLKINQRYLSHDYYTDVITFDLRNGPSDPYSADIFVSLERVRENSDFLKTDHLNELRRIMIHGILHLCGYNDKRLEDKARMTKMEDKLLSL